MRWTYRLDDFNRLFDECGDGTGRLGFTMEEETLVNYGLILNEKELRFIWLDRNLKKKDMLTLPLRGDAKAEQESFVTYLTEICQHWNDGHK